MWQETEGDYDVDTGRYSINYGECQICGKRLMEKRRRKLGLCLRCETKEKGEMMREREFDFDNAINKIL